MAPPWTVLAAAAAALAGCPSTVPEVPAIEAIPTPTSTQAQQQRPAGPPVGGTITVN